MIRTPFFWFSFATCLGFSACVHAATIGTYEADGLACVDKSATRAEADACRCSLEKRYQRPLKHCAVTLPLPVDAGKDGP